MRKTRTSMGGPALIAIAVAIFISLVMSRNVLTDIVSPARADETPITLSAFAPYGTITDTLGIIIGDTLSRAADIRGALRLAIQIPTIDTTDVKIQVAFDADSTFVPLYKMSAAGDTLTSWTLHNGTGGLAIDLTSLITGFNYFKVDLGDTMTVLRTFHYTIKR